MAILASISWLWLIVGMVAGYLVLPRVIKA